MVAWAGHPMEAEARENGRHVDGAASAGERTYAMWIHLGALIAAVVGAAPHFLGFWAPALVVLVMWQARRHESPFLDDHGREAMNFQISLLILYALAWVVGMAALCVGWIVTVPAVLILGMVGLIMGAVAGSRGEYFRYPMCIRVI